MSSPASSRSAPPPELDGGQQLVIALPYSREEHLAQGALRALVDVHQHGDLLRIIGIERRADPGELQAQGRDLGAEDFRDGQHRGVAAAAQFQRDSDQRMHIAQRAKSGENDPHARREA